jgi:ribonuclease T2
MRHGRRIAAILAAACLWIQCFWAQPALAQEPRDFTLALSWQAGFCAMRSDDASCAATGDWARRHFTLHGLWPNVDRNGDGRFNADDNYCLVEPERRQYIERRWEELPAPELSDATRQDLERVMPGTAALLERHQWVKHGTCSGFDAEHFFRTAIDRTEDLAATEFSRFVAAQAGRTVRRGDLLDRFELDFGKGSGRALRLFCKRPEGAVVLAEIRLGLRSHRIGLPMTRGSLAIPVYPQRSTCPERFLISAPAGK